MFAVRKHDSAGKKIPVDSLGIFFSLKLVNLYERPADVIDIRRDQFGGAPDKIALRVIVRLSGPRICVVLQQF